MGLLSIGSSPTFLLSFNQSDSCRNRYKKELHFRAEQNWEIVYFSVKVRDAPIINNKLTIVLYFMLAKSRIYNIFFVENHNKLFYHPLNGHTLKNFLSHGGFTDCFYISEQLLTYDTILHLSYNESYIELILMIIIRTDCNFPYQGYLKQFRYWYLSVTNNVQEWIFLAHPFCCRAWCRVSQQVKIRRFCLVSRHLISTITFSPNTYSLFTPKLLVWS